VLSFAPLRRPTYPKTELPSMRHHPQLLRLKQEARSFAQLQRQTYQQNPLAVGV
jgi:hypothetical protein